MSPLLALLRPRETPDLSLQSGPKRTLIRSLSPIVNETFFTDDAVHTAVGLKRRGTIRRLIERALT
jgi:hypothetical protein